jgi:hypothetical protein
MYIIHAIRYILHISPSPGRLFERPKVIYNDATNKWVMHTHWERNSNDYGATKVCGDSRQNRKCKKIT